MGPRPALDHGTAARERAAKTINERRRVRRYISADAKAVLQGLLARAVDERLGSKADFKGEIAKHAFFAPLDMDKVDRPSGHRRPVVLAFCILPMLQKPSETVFARPRSGSRPQVYKKEYKPEFVPATKAADPSARGPRRRRRLSGDGLGAAAVPRGPSDDARRGGARGSASRRRTIRARRRCVAREPVATALRPQAHFDKEFTSEKACDSVVTSKLTEDQAAAANFEGFSYSGDKK